VALEAMREALRDQRWRRRRSMICVGGRWTIVAVLLSRFDLSSALDLVTNLFMLLGAE
jgi:hypothetical protein